MRAEKHTCEKRIVHSTGLMRIGDRGEPCGKTATLKHEGKWYCKAHHPPTREAKFQERAAADRAAWEKQRAIETQIAADHARMEALDTTDWRDNLLDFLASTSVGFSGGLRAAIDQWMKERAPVRGKEAGR